MPLVAVILLVLIFFAIVLLYMNTENEWNWNYIIAIPAAILVLTAIGYGAYTYISTMASPQYSYWDITLGESQGDVKFKKGPPSYAGADGLWLYKDRDRNHEVGFGSDGKVTSITVYPNREYMYVKPILGIDTSATPESLQKRLGEPDRIESSADQLRRTYRYDEYQLKVVFERLRVVAMGIYQPDSR